MLLFWAKGYGATSMSDLETHLQLGRISLYGAFGGKKQLFLKCLEKYRRDITVPLLQKLDDKDGLRGIRNFFDTVLRSPPDIRRRGCLIVNTMVAAEEPDQVVDTVIKDHVLRVEQCFLRAIKAGQKAGTIHHRIKAHASARMLVTLAHGIFALHRVGVDPALTKTAVQTALATLIA